jgi:hypothetical protein
MPLTPKGKKIMTAMKKEYGPKKGERVFYASANKGKIKEFLKEKDKDYGTILNRGMQRKARQFELKKLYFDSSRPDDETDEEFSKNLKGKYKRSEIKKFLTTREDIDQFATEEEKEFLKEYFNSEKDEF